MRLREGRVDIHKPQTHLDDPVYKHKKYLRVVRHCDKSVGCEKAMVYRITFTYGACYIG